MKELPSITVALPMYRARRIGWLALEGLCRQQDAPAWELLISQEMAPEHDPLPLEAIQQYWPGLQEAGCVRLKVYTPGVHQALSLKWRDLAREAGPASHTFILQAADCYPHHHRLVRTHELLTTGGGDWAHQLQGLFLDPLANVRAMYHHPSSYPTALNMGVRTTLLRALPKEEVRKGVDRWLYKHATQANGGPLVVKCLPEHEMGLDTHGLNNISKKRGQKIALHTGYFRATTVRVRDVVPADIQERLKLLGKPEYA